MSQKNPYRSTMDLDLLRSGGGGIEVLPEEFKIICGQPVDKPIRWAHAQGEMETGWPLEVS